MVKLVDGGSFINGTTPYSLDKLNCKTTVHTTFALLFPMQRVTKVLGYYRYWDMGANCNWQARK